MNRLISSFCLTTLALGLLGVPAFGSRESRRTPVVIAVEKAIPAVVDVSTSKKIKRSVSPFRGLLRTPFDDMLFPPGLFEDTFIGTSLGSGFVVDTQGHIITNNHVVSYSQGQADEIQVLLHGEDVQRKAEIVGRDLSEDIAILRLVDNPTTQYIPFGNSSDLMIGETVIAIGYALGQSHTVTQGIISQLGRTIEDENGRSLLNLIQTDADINPGNSGGPLINLDGELVGVNTAIATPSGGSVGIGFAVPVNRVRKIYEHFVLHKQSLEQRLGIEVQTLYPRSRALLRAKRPGFQTAESMHGVLITRVEPGSPASGILAPLDVIQSLDGHRIETSDDITSDLIPITAKSVDVDILRNGESNKLTVSFRKQRTGVTNTENEQLWLGMNLAPLDAQRRKQLNLKSNIDGLVITKISKDSPANRAELKPLDIVFQIGPRNTSNRGFLVTSLDDLDEVIKRLQLENKLSLFFYRYERGRGWSQWVTEIDNNS